ncbi:MAG: carboxylesterase family protein [Proteobacteria bacterium]|nr:carboxylesterase family protein [Pseudomonadota bacterium]MBU1388328.1 carboxylesterase family protein [Pseudomonadota bacterium]MBU1542854.1 carboxylesterase family protein [Pseudomonadota bacterium]MBU2479674.1 carboxylesterase family protein [Pseudomonadota bacterium]
MMKFFKRSKWFCQTQFLLSVSLAVIVFAGFNGVCSAKGHDKISTSVSTLNGEIEGYIDANDTLAWKAIPYAIPPARFEPPKDPANWEGIREAKTDCEKCTQLNSARNGIDGSEDCLYLNIWRPNTNEKNLPVFFWIHGGGNNAGTMQDFNGAQIAARSNVVFVAIQYRLGPLGWLTHPGMRNGDDPLKDSGNYGLLDIIKALEWVQKNIGAFGGKAQNVTIAGESAGGRNVLSLLASPLASGLFHKAISQSGSTHTLTMAQADAKTAATLTAIGFGDAPDDEVLQILKTTDAYALFSTHITTGVDFSHPQGDGTVLLEGGPIPAIQSGNYNKVPIILGSNKDEMKYFMPHYGPALQWAFYMNPEYGVSVPVPSGAYYRTSYSWLNLLDVLTGTLALDDVLTTQADKILYEACAQTGSLKWRFAGVDNVARALKEHQSKVYAYQLQWDGADDITRNSYSFIYGAAHATDLSFFFGADADVFGGAAFGPGYDTPGRQQLSAAMMDYVAKFVRSGNPNKGCGPFKWRHTSHKKGKASHGDLPVWKKWSNEEGKPKTIVFDANMADKDIYMISEEVTAQSLESNLWNQYFTLPPEVANALFFFDWDLL